MAPRDKAYPASPQLYTWCMHKLNIAHYTSHFAHCRVVLAGEGGVWSLVVRIECQSPDSRTSWRAQGSKVWKNSMGQRMAYSIWSEMKTKGFESICTLNFLEAQRWFQWLQEANENPPLLPRCCESNHKEDRTLTLTGSEWQESVACPPPLCRRTPCYTSCPKSPWSPWPSLLSRGSQRSGPT